MIFDTKFKDFFFHLYYYFCNDAILHINNVILLVLLGCELND